MAFRKRRGSLWISRSLVLRNRKKWYSKSRRVQKTFWPKVSSRCLVGRSGELMEEKRTKIRIEDLKFQNTVLKKLPVDSSRENISREVPNSVFSIIDPTPLENPQTVAHSQSCLDLLELDEKQVERGDFPQYFSGSKVFEGARPAAHCYCGHQFGFFSGQLGDGATMYIGEVLTSSDGRWEIQYKGAGKTPYSRRADGRKVLRSSIREFLCSEAMHSLGIPSTRAASCVTSDTYVVRDVFYSGNPIKERATVVVRVGRTFLRFGSFEIVKGTDSATGRKGPSSGNKDILRQLLDFTIESYFKEIWDPKKDKEEMYTAFLKEVTHRTAYLVAQWQCVGFCHGVLNTDNMSIIGLTIDYGPFGFMDHFDENYVCNGSDDGARYSYKNQPKMCLWNCKKLAEMLGVIGMDVDELKTMVKSEFWETYHASYRAKMLKKLGIATTSAKDADLIEELMDVMGQTGADMTNTFRNLTFVDIPDKANDEVADCNAFLKYVLTQVITVEAKQKKLKGKYSEEQLMKLINIAQTNPRMLPMYGIFDAKVLVREFKNLQALKELGDDDTKRERDAIIWKTWLADYRERLFTDWKASGLTKEEFNAKRIELMNDNNPLFILRNYVAEDVIRKAKKGDYQPVKDVLELLQDPYGKKSPQNPKLDEYSTTPDWAHELAVT